MKKERIPFLFHGDVADPLIDRGWREAEESLGHRVVPPSGLRVASGPNQVWCWDMAFLATPVLGRWFYLYLILDLYSRGIVGWEVHDSDSADHAAHLARRTAPARTPASATGTS